jgi:hypothetical protein
MSAIPKGYCQCGCGNATIIYQKNDLRRGRIKGQPARFLMGHKSISIELRENIKNERKRCPKCGEVKNLSMFSVDKSSKHGHCSQCKECRRQSFDKWRSRNLGYAKRYMKDWHKENAEECRQYNKRWRIENPEKAKILNKKSRINRIKTPKGKLNHHIGTGICGSLRGAKRGRHWESLVGFTVMKLKRHIERQFLPGMTWENYGRDWHIDHKIPIAAFNFSIPEDLDFRRCWALKNLQPLWAKENWGKGAKLKKQFQPSLNIAVGATS